MPEPTAASKPTGVPDPTQDPWRAAFEEFKIRDKRMAKEFRDEIDTLLVLVRGSHLPFVLVRMTLASQAGLFSAVLTAFVIESYQHLREDPAKTTVDLLRYISHQLANSSLPAASDSPQFQAQQSDVRVNVCWFVSLFLSLFVALFGIFFKQWMCLYLTWMDVTPYKDAVELRHFRYRMLTSWRIETILALLPTLLQIAVVVFLGGLLTFLWDSVPSLTIIMAVLSCIACFLVAAATILPGLSQLCPYRSSLSRFVAIPIRYVLDHVKSTIDPPLQTAVRRAFHLAVEAVFIVAWISYARWPNLNLSESVAHLAKRVTTFVRHFIPFTFSQQSLLPWLKGQHAGLSSFLWLGDQSVTTLFTSWLDVDKGALVRLTNERHVSMGVGAMVHLCSTTQSPGLREATIMAIMSQYPDDGPMESGNDDAYCNEVWWPIVGDIMHFNKENLDDLADTFFGRLFFYLTVQSRFSSFSLSMQHHWLDFLSSLEDLVCRSQSKHVIKAYLICRTASVDSHGGGGRMLALVAVLQSHHLELDRDWLDSIAYSLSMSASIWKDEPDGDQVYPYNWDRPSGKLFCEIFVSQCFDHTSGAEFITSMQDLCDELQDVRNLTTTQTGKYQWLLDLLAQLVCQVALAMEPAPREHVPEDLKGFLVALRRVHQVCPPYPSYRISASCATSLVIVARDEPDLFPKPFARAMVRQIEGRHLSAVAEEVTGLDLDGVDMYRLGTSWDDLDARSRGVIERLIEPEPFKKILVVYEGDVRGRG
jgi:hypothetical protein